MNHDPGSRHRRHFLTLLGAGLVAGRAGAQPACVLTPRQIEGPYYLDRRLQRSDIRADAAGGPLRNGVPLDLTLRVLSVRDGCSPVPNAVVDIWHCDAA